MGPQHLLANLIQDGTSFPERVGELTSALERAAHLPPGKAKYTLDDLSRIESAIRRAYPPDRRAEPDIFLPLVAFCTEIGRREAGGRWEMRLAKDGKTWEPWVVDQRGNHYEFFTLVYKQFCDVPDSLASVAGAILGKVRARILLPMTEAAHVNAAPEETHADEVRGFYQNLLDSFHENEPSKRKAKEIAEKDKGDGVN